MGTVIGLANILVLLLAFAFYLTFIWGRFQQLLSTDLPYFRVSSFAMVAVYGPFITILMVSLLLPLIDATLTTAGLDFIGGRGIAITKDWIGTGKFGPAVFGILCSAPYMFLIVYAAIFQIIQSTRGYGYPYSYSFPLVMIAWLPCILAGLTIFTTGSNILDTSVSLPRSAGDVSIGHFEPMLTAAILWLTGLQPMLLVIALSYFSFLIFYPTNWFNRGYMQPMLVSWFLGGLSFYFANKAAHNILMKVVF